MKTIPSFRIDHNKLTKGIYISRIDDDITTYDIRMREPNRETVMTNAAMHTIEHIFATYVRNTEFGDNIIYFGPMGCRTGFYFLTRSLTDAYSINRLRKHLNLLLISGGRFREQPQGNAATAQTTICRRRKKRQKRFMKSLRIGQKRI